MQYDHATMQAILTIVTFDAVCSQRDASLYSQLADAISINVHSGEFPRGTGPIFLDDVFCEGDESNIDDCSHNRVSVHNCVHMEDAGVICLQQGSKWCLSLLNQRFCYYAEMISLGRR